MFVQAETMILNIARWTGILGGATKNQGEKARMNRAFLFVTDTGTQENIVL
jgi:hypothetical protein